MNLLESVLCTCNAKQYYNNFKQQEIDAHTLKILTGEDLRLLGVAEEDVRNKMLQLAANLQIRAEKRIDICIDRKYVDLVLNQMSVQLTRHLAALSIALRRQDIVVCNVKLGPAVRCLTDCVESLGKQLNEFEAQLITGQEKKKNRTPIVATAVLIGVITFAIYKSSHYFFKA